MKKNILFIYNNYSSFVETDYKILASKHIVSKYYFRPRKGFSGLLELSKQFFFIMLNIWRFDAVFIWFADYHSFLPVLFTKISGKKSFVIIGGYDVANIPELKYGSLSKPFRKAVTLYTFRYTDLCIPVVESLEEKLKEICPAARSETIHTGYKFNTKINSQLIQERENIILTVSVTNSWQRMLIKGLDRFKELAEKLPDFQCCIIGVDKNTTLLFDPHPSNLILIPSLNKNELIEYYCKASFYAQLSRSEGLPNALCEAMLYGCIPLGLKIGGIPTAIDELGLVMNEWDAKIAASFILKNHNKLDRKLTKEHIKRKFNLDYRAEKLLKRI